MGDIEKQYPNDFAGQIKQEQKRIDLLIHDLLLSDLPNRICCLCSKDVTDEKHMMAYPTNWEKDIKVFCVDCAPEPKESKEFVDFIKDLTYYRCVDRMEGENEK